MTGTDAGGTEQSGMEAMNTNTTTPTTDRPLLLTAHEAAKELQICEKSLWTLTAPRGAIPCVRFGRSVRYTLADLTEWIESAKSKKTCENGE